MTKWIASLHLLRFVRLAMTEKSQNLIVDCHENPTDFLAMTENSQNPNKKSNEIRQISQ
ncbi:hypothetical protein ACWIUD_09615 [Helicobacter sp. 23-1044]